MGRPRASRVHLPPGPGPGTEQLRQWGGGLASRAGLGRAGGRGVGGSWGEPASQESPGISTRPWVGREGGGPPRPPRSTPSAAPSDGRFGVPKPILQDLSNRQPHEGPRVGIPAPGPTRRAGRPLSLNKGRCRAHVLTWPCGQPQALATHEAGWPSRPVGTGWPRKVLLWKLNAQPECSTASPAQSSLVRSCHVASPPTETQEVPPRSQGSGDMRGVAVMIPRRQQKRPHNRLCPPGLQLRSRDPRVSDPSPASTRLGAQRLFI